MTSASQEIHSKYVRLNDDTVCCLGQFWRFRKGQSCEVPLHNLYGQLDSLCHAGSGLFRRLRIVTFTPRPEAGRDPSPECRPGVRRPRPPQLAPAASQTKIKMLKMICYMCYICYAAQIPAENKSKTSSRTIISSATLLLHRAIFREKRGKNAWQHPCPSAAPLLHRRAKATPAR